MRGEPSEEEQVSRGDEGSREFIHVDLKIIFPEISKHRVGSDEGKEAGGALCSYGVHLGCVSILAMKAIIPLAMLVVLPSHGQEAVLDLTELHSMRIRSFRPIFRRTIPRPTTESLILGPPWVGSCFMTNAFRRMARCPAHPVTKQEHGFADPAVASCGGGGGGGTAFDALDQFPFCDGEAILLG